MTNRTVTLGGETFAVSPRPLGVMRDLVPAFIRCSTAFSASVVDETAFRDGCVVLALGLGKSMEEVEALPATFEEFVAAMDTIAAVCGLKAKEAPPGEAKQAESSTGTNSTPG